MERPGEYAWPRPIWQARDVPVRLQFMSLLRARRSKALSCRWRVADVTGNRAIDPGDFARRREWITRRQIENPTANARRDVVRDRAVDQAQRTAVRDAAAMARERWCRRLARCMVAANRTIGQR